MPVPVEPNRINVIIGRDGRNKARLEEGFNVRLEVDTKNSVVYIVPQESVTPFQVMKAKQAIEAISLGFSVKDALLLTDDVIYFEVIDLTDVTRNRKDLERIKARVIGSEGKFKKTLEEMTGAKIVIGEKRIGIIGDYEQAKLARETIEMIVNGKSHQTALNHLKMESRRLKRRRMELWEKWSSIR